MTALGQHSIVPPFYANRAKVAPCMHTARTAREAPSEALQDVYYPCLSTELVLDSACYAHP